MVNAAPLPVYAEPLDFPSHITRELDNDSDLTERHSKTVQESQLTTITPSSTAGNTDDSQMNSPSFLANSQEGYCTPKLCRAYHYSLSLRIGR